MSNTLLSDNYLELLKKYNKPGPRYTSYPTAPEWRDNYTSDEYIVELEKLNNRKDDSISLYFHIPFCEERCLYCGCNVIIDKKRSYVAEYLDLLEKEMHLFFSKFDHKINVGQIHWGGGTPTFLNEAEITRLYKSIEQYINLEEKAEIAIEVDPCVTTKEQLKVLRSLGFNRLSMGVQDFNEEVLKIVERNQSYEVTKELIDYARSIGFDSINLDFIYGLPLQTAASFEETVDQILGLAPDRIALFSYAKIPWLKPHQKKINDYLPEMDEKFAIFLNARKRLLTEGNYIAIGMDHFAKENDEIAVALKEKSLHRNFMGYTVQSTEHFIGFGVSSIGYLNNSYAQNVKTLREYREALNDDKLPVERGTELTEEDKIRKWVIYSLMCQFELDFRKFKKEFAFEFTEKFSEELKALDPFIEDGFMELLKTKIKIKEMGTLFIRNIAMEFDLYLKNKQMEKRFSQTV